MSLSAALPRRAGQLGPLRRYASSKASKARTLSDEKMRALISLYHQSDTFITPQNLSQRIDETFIPDGQLKTETQIRHRDLKQALDSQRMAPKMANWDQEMPVTAGSNWSSAMAVREFKVIEALYGVDVSPSKAVLPGLEALEEYVATKPKTPPQVPSKKKKKVLRKNT